MHRIRHHRAQQRERAPEAIVASLPTGTWTGEGLVFDDFEKEVGVVAHPQPRKSTPAGADINVQGQEPAVGLNTTETLSSSESAKETEPTTTDETQKAPAPIANVQATLPDDASAVASTSAPPTGRRPVANGRKYLKKAWFATQTECAICLGEFERGDRLRILPCGHIFHVDEVDAWLIQRKKLVSEIFFCISMQSTQ